MSQGDEDLGQMARKFQVFCRQGKTRPKKSRLPTSAFKAAIHPPDRVAGGMMVRVSIVIIQIDGFKKVICSHFPVNEIVIL